MRDQPAFDWRGVKLALAGSVVATIGGVWVVFGDGGRFPSAIIGIGIAMGWIGLVMHLVAFARRMGRTDQ